MKPRTSPRRRNFTQRFGFIFLRLVAIITVLPIIAILIFIVFK
ncbi:MAG: hypothetical protein V3U36_01610 [Anaerolineales bacterium]